MDRPRGWPTSFVDPTSYHLSFLGFPLFQFLLISILKTPLCRCQPFPCKPVCEILPQVGGVLVSRRREDIYHVVFIFIISWLLFIYYQSPMSLVQMLFSTTLLPSVTVVESSLERRSSSWLLSIFPSPIQLLFAASVSLPSQSQATSLTDQHS